MPTKNRKTDPSFVRMYERGMLRSAFVSLFWAVISARKKRPEGFTLQSLAKAIGSSKHEVSRWFNGDPNWTLNTVANLAYALDLELTIHARERSTGIVYTPAGVIQSTAFAQTLPLGGSTTTQTLPMGEFVRRPARWDRLHIESRFEPPVPLPPVLSAAA